MINELNQVLSNNILKHYGHIALVIVLFISVSQVSAQSILHRADSILAQRYLKGDIDTAYVVRPSTKWTVTARMNVSGAKIKAEGIDHDKHFPPGSFRHGSARLSRLGKGYGYEDDKHRHRCGLWL